MNLKVVGVVFVSGLILPGASCGLFSSSKTPSRQGAVASQQPLPGSYAGRFGDTTMALELRADGTATVNMGDDGLWRWSKTFGSV